ncbi:general substrate transporter [Collybia nuda]|uniref:General substrate transporter n=1 Tax=Collybia nuda TaxID=64659 RepID=A0A9P5XXX3_9AGAR|nr:general substrate transporter [Collybia nuda]
MELGFIGIFPASFPPPRRVHSPPNHSSKMGSLLQAFFKNSRVYWMAFIVYWGIVLFGYDTGIGGGVVSSGYFQQSFGLLNDDGSTNTRRSNDVSSNVVSVLQAGAFFGALGSAPISSRIGRIYTLVVFSLLFLVGAILTTVANGGPKGLSEIYAGRVISGVGIGAISAVAPAYVSECSPKEVRGRITGLFQIMVAIGVMISYFINFGVGIHIKTGVNVWRIPFGFQLVPAGIMAIGLLTIKESPRWLASVGRHREAIKNLAYLRKESIDSEAVIHEMAEIETAIQEEREARKGLGLKEAFFGKGNFIRFVIAFVIFLLQQWGGQNSVNYYAPQIFTSIGFTGTKNSLLASGIYGVVKVVATAIFIFFGVETLGRKGSLFVSAMGMGTLFFIIGAILKTHPPPVLPKGVTPPTPPPASRAMAGMLYIYVCFYSMGWGPLPWVYVSDIFPTRTRHYGLALASATQWLFNFVVSKVTPDMISDLGYKIFLMFAAVNIGAMGLFSALIPETKGRSLEEMDVIFGSITAEQRQADIDKRERALEASEKVEGVPHSDHSSSLDNDRKV